MRNNSGKNVLLDKEQILAIINESRVASVLTEDEDYFHVGYHFNRQNNKLTAEIIPLVPTNLSSTQKGRIGELIGKIALEFKHMQIMELQDSNCEFDILDTENGERYDVKFSLEHADEEDHASYWKFCLKGDRTPKDYEQDAEYLLLIGTYNKSELEPAFYLLPSDCREVKEFTEIRIATSGKSVYEKYRFYPFRNEE